MGAISLTLPDLMVRPSLVPRRRVARISNHCTRFEGATAVSLQGTHGEGTVGWGMRGDDLIHGALSVRVGKISDRVTRGGEVGMWHGMEVIALASPVLVVRTSLVPRRRVARISNHCTRFEGTTAVSLQGTDGGGTVGWGRGEDKLIHGTLGVGVGESSVLVARGGGGLWHRMGTGPLSSLILAVRPSLVPRRRVARVSNHCTRFEGATAVSLQGTYGGGTVGWRGRGEIQIRWTSREVGRDLGRDGFVSDCGVVASFNPMWGSGGWNRWSPRDSTPLQMSVEGSWGPIPSPSD